jgi:hypothetical protein
VSVKRLPFVLAIALLVVAACGTPRERQPIGEIPAGPGLLSGEKGAFEIRR